MDGLQLVVAEIALVAAVAALLAGILGWLIGRRSGRRRAEKSFADAMAAVRLTPAKHVADDVPAAPVAPVETPVEPVAVETVPEPIVVEPVAAVEPEPVPEPVLPESNVPEPASPWSPPDVTVIRPPSSGTVAYAPSPFAILPSDPSARLSSVAEVQELRRELRAKDLELGRLEAGALSAWDRTVPQLENQLTDLIAENDSLQRKIREAQEHSAADALTAEHLRDLVADRDARLAELRSQG